MTGKAPSCTLAQSSVLGIFPWTILVALLLGFVPACTSVAQWSRYCTDSDGACPPCDGGDECVTAVNRSAKPALPILHSIVFCHQGAS